MSSTTARHTNRLIDETSPYLLQHAHNPVDWFPWGAEAHEKARSEDKPILLSIGYSACHWCHVMEQESFEDEAVAGLMNTLYVCIKVDREERPDLDKIYQLAYQMLAQRPGGWPLTMFLSPDDHTPFFGGTYFPNAPRYGMPAFTDILRRVATYFRDQRSEITAQNTAIRNAFGRIQPGAPEPGLLPGPELLAAARRELAEHFDAREGGWGGAPKFPHPTNIDRCLRQWASAPREPDLGALAMARHTLSAMALGGIYDQIGGGFCRYSVDQHWMIPHFEKMLYDNAQLLALYCDAAIATGDELFRRVATETAEWLMREMQSADGGYYSTLDADSEGREGKFYVWTKEELRTILSDDEYRVVAPHFGLNRPANFENEFWHLRVCAAGSDVGGTPAGEVRRVIDSARRKIFAARERRVRPGRDEKVLTSWNGLAIRAMAHAGRFLGRGDFIDSAQRALDFVRARLWKDGRLLATCKDGAGRLGAYLDDYAFLIDGVLEVVQARWRDGDLMFAVDLAETLLDHYEDERHGAFFFTADDHEPLIHRPKPAGDDALPSGNGVAALALQRLGHILGDAHFLDAAEKTIRALYREAAAYPSGHNALLGAVEEHLEPPQTVVLRGPAEAMGPWVERCQRFYAPRRIVLAIPDTATVVPGVLASRGATGGVTGYVCSGHACSAPVTELDALGPLLDGCEMQLYDSVTVAHE
ncbi:MAG: thioredoxin domain-containing protein [Gammaproteobacteria bacterium]|nr:thioredoxin domain-containing protein [Gammaproteobacteria bacterium]